MYPYQTYFLISRTIITVAGFSNVSFYAWLAPQAMHKN
jgi:hypothetical protein